MGGVVGFGLRLWVIRAPIRPSQPDTFLNLLPNAFYLIDYGRFPSSVLPPSFSFLPAAPYGSQYLSFLASFLDRGHPASGLSLVNLEPHLGSHSPVSCPPVPRPSSPPTPPT